MNKRMKVNPWKIFFKQIIGVSSKNPKRDLDQVEQSWYDFVLKMKVNLFNQMLHI